MHVIAKIKTVSTNQLKSGDLSIKTATIADMEALRQFLGDWEQRIGNGSIIRTPSYGVLAHGIRTSLMNMEWFEEVRDSCQITGWKNTEKERDKKRTDRTQYTLLRDNSILQDNKPFIPNAEIKYIGWLTQNSKAKMASSIIVEFKRAEDANKIIDKGLIWQGEVFQYERYDRQCRLRQCFKCHKYGHIGTQCKANVVYGYCAQPHPTKECPAKNDRNAPRKCAACQDNHKAWSPSCPVRKQELSKIKTAYNLRPRYHPVPEESVRLTPPAKPQGQPALRSITLTPSQRPDRSRSPNKQGQKRLNPDNSQAN
ncbi:hypothetical protein S40288_09566 [Stachybotrys chartarum IBT 40288]|nr:hypothetical protein S40288_09566 [Stachybotrys chartarum IBT 40288]